MDCSATFSVQVLELRIAETAVGGLVGIAAAYFIFSTGTRATLIDKVDDYLDQMIDLIGASIDSVLAPGGETDLVAQTRRLDNALKDVLTAGKPLEMGPTGRSRRGARRLLRGLQVGNRSAHALARAGVNAARADPDTAPPNVTAVGAARGRRSGARHRQHRESSRCREQRQSAGNDTDNNRSWM